jgi:hypothetical protein
MLTVCPITTGPVITSITKCDGYKYARLAGSRGFPVSFLSNHIDRSIDARHVDPIPAGIGM